MPGVARPRLLLLALLLTTAIVRFPTPHVVVGAAPDTPPKLIVIVVADQMRADYATEYGARWTGGLKRLLATGAVFERAAYPYFNTLTCVGHSTIGTGVYPHGSGIVGNEWWDHEAQRTYPCAEDDIVRPVAYGPGREPIGNGPHRLAVPTFAEQMHARGNRVVTLSLKPRSAIMLAGHHADAVTWFDERSLTWATSSAYAQAPVREVQQFVATHPIEADLGKTWDRLLPSMGYKYADDGLGERPPKGWTTTFPHMLPGSKGPDFYSQWASTPFADAYVVRMAIALVDGLRLGQRSGTDVLAVSFSTLDLAGHAFGPASHEVQDVLLGLDQSLAALFGVLDAKVGRGRYVVALTADHGVAPIPEQRIARGEKAGRIDMKKLRRALDTGCEQALGPGSWVEAFASGYVYLRPGGGARLKNTPGALSAIVAAARTVEGIRTVLDMNAVSTTSADPIARAAALGEYGGRSGDLLVVPEPYYVPDGIATTHGTPYEYDQRVPLILMGAGIRPGRYQDAVSPADLAPTLAALAGVTLPDANGRPLRSALASASARRVARSH